MFLISWLLFSTSHLKSYYSFLEQSMMESFSGFLLLSITYDQNWKEPRRKRWEFWENFLAERLCLFFEILKNIWLLVYVNNPTYLLDFLKLAVIILPSPLWHCRSSRLQMFFKIGVFKNFVNVTEKHTCVGASV